MSNIIIDALALKRLCLGVVHQALKDKDLAYFRSEEAEEVCSAVNLNREALAERVNQKVVQGGDVLLKNIEIMEKQPPVKRGKLSIKLPETTIGLNSNYERGRKWTHGKFRKKKSKRQG